MIQYFLTVLTIPETYFPRRLSCNGAFSFAAIVMVWGSVLLPPRRATAHEAATDVGTTIVVEGHITDIGPRAQHTNAKISEEEFQRLLSDLKVHGAEMYRATIILGRLGDKRAIEPILEKLRSGHVVEEANQALEQLGADKEDIFQANVLAARKLRKAAVAYLGELGDKRAIAYIIEVFNKEGAFFTEPCDINDLTWYLNEANTTLQKLDADIEEKLKINLNIIQWHDQYDSVLIGSIEFIGSLKDKRAIKPLIDAWRKRNEIHLYDIHKILEKLRI